ncbi:sulfurtransferase TusA [Reinekea marina]|uniref:Sulfur carrier protein TusA n=1 Tax=Reinekea marina TaxID=1310421 RepID=A0ABV7WRK5_9GAMM|nr:sulfurtransferase TusA [Reinekea marina]MDN3650241.1 sulfurtransferase TusA [Reinekea marina]
MSDLVADIELDTKGLKCPEPVMMLHRQIRKMAVGEVVKVIATDPATMRDIPSFCEFLPHELLSSSVEDEVYLFWLKKGQR